MKTSGRLFIHLMVMAFMLVSCHSEMIEYPASDPAYPTKFPILTPAQIAEKMAVLNQIKDSADLITIDQFGFLSIQHTFPDTLTLNAKSVKEMVYNKIKRYYSFLGLEKLTYTEFQSMFYYRMLVTGGSLKPSQDDELFNRTLKLIYPPSNAKIRAYMPQGHFQNYPIEATSIEFYIDEKSHQITISGLWQQQMYIPPYDAVSANDAVTIALNDLIHYENGIPLPFSFEKILQYTKKVIRPVVKDNEYQLRVCWKLTIENYFVQYYIDTQTGEIVLIYNYHGNI